LLFVTCTQQNVKFVVRKKYNDCIKRKDCTKNEEIKIKCNIPIMRLLNVSIEEGIRSYAAARITAGMESETLIFSGVIFELDDEWVVRGKYRRYGERSATG